jgi:HSP90 family molecular chaperone
MSASVVHVATVDEARFLGHLKSMFSSSTKVLAELMQNARRAKATKVDFEFDPETATLVVTDNGCGIDTFRAILTVAESGWAEDVQAAEHPYGLGFFSVVFGAESILVESKGRAIRFTSDDLINLISSVNRRG